MESHSSTTRSLDTGGYHSKAMDRDVNVTPPTDNDVDPDLPDTEAGATDGGVDDEITNVPSDTDAILDDQKPTSGSRGRRDTLQRGLRRMTMRIQGSLPKPEKSQVKMVKGLCLRLIQTVLMLTTFGAGLVISIRLWWTVLVFDTNCPLYMDVTLRDSPNDTLIMVTYDIEGTDMRQCLYCAFGAVVATIYALMWLWFFLFMNMIRDWKLHATANGQPPVDLAMMIPTIWLNSIMFICMLVVAIMVTAGVGSWCSHIEEHLGEVCEYVSTKAWDNVQYGQLTYDYLQSAVIGSWLLLVVLGCHTVVVTVRVYRYHNRDRSYKEKEWLTDDRAEINKDQSDYGTLPGSVIFEKLPEYVPSEGAGQISEPPKSRLDVTPESTEDAGEISEQPKPCPDDAPVFLENADQNVELPKPCTYELHEVMIHPRPPEASVSDTMAADTPRERGDSTSANKVEKQVLVQEDDTCRQ